MGMHLNARYTLLLWALCGEVLFAGAIFGWNALSLMLKTEGLYNEGCGEVDNCSSQDTKLAVIWTTGVFATNFSSVLGGPSLDYFGPRVTAALGALQATIGMLLMSCAPQLTCFASLHSQSSTTTVLYV
jgi:hypothetical protein